MKVIATVLLGFLFVLSGPAHAADEAGARTFIEDLGQRAVEILNQPDLTAERSVKQFRDLFRTSFDTQ
ncbi:MAG TPA: ABC transporter substrate-binding protein, partial [Alphaproteobacteria bacterium]|nr:ABC transporter substrate-binding protein [Alphaproteobacteria bacterium]